MKTIRWNPALVGACAALAGCASISLEPGADQIHITRNAADVAACESLGRVNLTKGMLTDPDAERQLQNETLALGGDALLMASLGRSGTAYRCGAPRPAPAAPTAAPAAAPPVSPAAGKAEIAAQAPAETARTQVAAPTGSAPEQAIAALENLWLQSQKLNDPDLIAPMLADKYVSTGADGKVSNKAEALAEARDRTYTSAEYENVRITVFGDTAIATGGFRGKGSDNTSGKSFDEHERWTDTWVKMPDGKWRCVATQVSPITN